MHRFDRVLKLYNLNPADFTYISHDFESVTFVRIKTGQAVTVRR